MKATVRSAPSALTAIGGFAVAVAALSVGATASVVLLMPDPPAIHVTVAEAAAALRGHPTKLERREAAPLAGPSATLLLPVLARELGRPVSALRVVWLETGVRGASHVLMMPGGAVPKDRPATLVVRRDGDGSADGRANPLLHGMIVRAPSGILSGMQPRPDVQRMIDALILALPQPAFAASMREPSGRWITVYPSRPFLNGWRLKILAALGVSLLLLAPLVWVFARRLTDPFRSLAAAIENDKPPPRPAGPRELREAAAAIAGLRTRLAADAEERMRMLIAVAHDLRTPLTSLRLRVESASEPQRSRMVADAERMATMIDDVLSLARVADALRRPVAVRALVSDVLLTMPAANGRVTLMSNGPEAQVMVVEAAFRRAIENLVRNAVDHAGGGRIEVSADGFDVVVAIIDAGPGIPIEDRARLVRPFERGDASRNRATGGVGLGLSIVQSFADLHGGEFRIAEAAGGGTVASLRLAGAR